MSTEAPQMPTFQAPQTTTPAAEQPGPSATGIETFEDLPPDPSQDQESVSASSGDQPEDDVPDTMDFETLLAKANPAPTPAPVTPQPGTASPAQPAAAPVAPTGVPDAAAVAAAQAVLAAAQGTQQQPALATPQAAPAQGVPEQTLDQLRTEMDKNKGVIVSEIAKHYESTFTDEDVDLFQSEPKKALAQMAARLHVDSLSNTMAVFSENLPRMVLGLIKAQQVSQTETDAFYKEYPVLNQQAHGQVVNSIAATLRRMNPTMDTPTFKATLGAMALQALRLQHVPAAPKAPAQPQTQQPRAPRGFQPAGNGQVPAGPNSAAGINPWDAMVQAAMADDK
jgi:hypothetical protein